MFKIPLQDAQEQNLVASTAATTTGPHTPVPSEPRGEATREFAEKSSEASATSEPLLAVTRSR